MLPYLVAILPPTPLAKKVNELKNYVIERCGVLQESLSTPHITLNLNRFPNIELLDKALTEYCESFPSIEISVEGLNTFPGQTTVIFAKIKDNPALQTLQQKMCQALAPLREGEHIRELGTPLTPEQVQTSEMFGYPYVGKEWVPHMTVAFFDNVNFQKIGQELLKKPIEGKFTANVVTLLSLHKAENNWEWRPFRVYPLKAL